MSQNGIARWHEFMVSGDTDLLYAQLAEDCVFKSPVVHTPQEGKAICGAYLTAAQQFLGGADFEYVGEFDCGSKAVLEFSREVDGLAINGVDMIEWNDAGEIIDFKVMVRPRKALEKCHEEMGALLAQMTK